MRYLLNAQQMKACDEATINRFKVPSLVLMERAALAVRDEVLERFPEARKILVICGSGNNGGDGFAAARLLNQCGRSAHVLFVGKHEKMTEETKRQSDIFEAYGGIVLPDETPIKGYDLILDALFGIGLHREVIGRYADVIGAVNRADIPVIAIDIPSGVSADTGQVMGCAVQAQVTVTMAFAKIGQMLYPGAECCGEVVVKDIGITDDGIQAGFISKAQESLIPEEPVCELDRSDLKDLLPHRFAAANKGSYGKLLLIAGAKNMAGAAALSARAAYRTGCGLVCVLSDEENRLIIQNAVPEAIFAPWPETEKPDESGLSARLAWADAIAIGPGLGTGEKSLAILKQVLGSFSGPVVIDADALNLIALHPELTDGGRLNAVITPHPGEMSRLSRLMPGDERSIPFVTGDPVGTAMEAARTFGCVSVLKGARTVITDGEQVWLNVAGNEGMATGGSGDVLTGIIGSLMAQGAQMADAAKAGVLIHAMAGDEAAKEMGTRSLIASDLVRYLPAVLAG